MTEINIRNGIARALRKVAPEAVLERVHPDDDLRETLDIDSFDYLNFLIGLHEELGVDVPETDYAKVRTLRGLLQYVGARMPQPYGTS